MSLALQDLSLIYRQAWWKRYSLALPKWARIYSGISPVSNRRKLAFGKNLMMPDLLAMSLTCPAPTYRRLVLRMAPMPSSVCWRLISLRLQPLLLKALPRRVRLGTGMLRVIERLFEPRSITMALRPS